MFGKFQLDCLPGAGVEVLTPSTLPTAACGPKLPRMKYFACTYTYGDDAALIDATRPKHREFISNQLGLGRIVGSGPYVDGTQALIIIQLPDTATESDATELMDQDPYIAAGALAKREIREWNPVSNIFS
ncbi:hypothetical protein GCM10009631_03290 [Corynebacterium glaucum]